MNLTKEVDFSNRYNYFYTLLFLIFLTPFYLAIGDEGLSANYSFVLFPIFLIFKKKLLNPKPLFLYFIAFYILIFIFASLYQYHFYSYFSRRLISFILFISMFSFFFIPVEKTMLNSFKDAIIIISLIFSLITFFKFLFLGANEIGFAAKGEVGSQRFGFIYVMAIWILFLDKRLKNLLITIIVLFIIIVGLLLTFSRSGIVSLALSGSLFLMFSLYKWFHKPNLSGIFKIGFFIILSIFFYNILYIKFPLLFDFFNERLIQFLSGNSNEQLDLTNTDSSEGYRILMIKNAIKFVLFNPITGAGFLGIWVISEDLSGSAHNQYLDILFRTGIIGFLIYIYLLSRIFFKLKKIDISLFWGFVAVLFYGFVHETFKLSHGAFVLAFFFSLIRNFSEDLRINEK